MPDYKVNSGGPGVYACLSALWLGTRKALILRGIFLPDNALLDRISHIPGTIAQGRYDVICPIITADRLRRAWPALLSTSTSGGGWW